MKTWWAMTHYVNYSNKLHDGSTCTSMNRHTAKTLGLINHRLNRNIERQKSWSISTDKHIISRIEFPNLGCITVLCKNARDLKKYQIHEMFNILVDKYVSIAILNIPLNWHSMIQIYSLQEVDYTSSSYILFWQFCHINMTLLLINSTSVFLFPFLFYHQLSANYSWSKMFSWFHSLPPYLPPHNVYR